MSTAAAAQMLSVSFWVALLVGCVVLWVTGLRLFLRSGLSARRKLVWTGCLLVAGALIAVLLPLDGIRRRFLVLLAALPILAGADVVLLRSRRGFSFWIRACGFEVCTVFAVAGAVRYAFDLVRLPGTHSMWTAALLVLVINLPFGFWRAGLRRFTLPWIVAVHAPVPMAIGLRMLAGMGWRLSTLPVFVGAFFAGQFLGGRFRASWRAR